MHLLTHVLAQTLFCQHTFTNKYWALCFKQKYTKIDSLSPPVSAVHHASFSRQDSNRCSLDLVNESLFYPLLNDFTSLPSLLCLHTSVLFLFPFFTFLPPHRSIGSFLPFPLVKSSETFCMSGQRSTGLFFFCCAVQHLCTNSPPYLDQHAALSETKQHWGQRMRANRYYRCDRKANNFSWPSLCQFDTPSREQCKLIKTWLSHALPLTHRCIHTHIRVHSNLWLTFWTYFLVNELARSVRVGFLCQCKRSHWLLPYGFRSTQLIFRCALCDAPEDKMTWVLAVALLHAKLRP